MIDSKNKIALKNMMEYVLYDEINVANRIFVSWKEFEIAIEELYRKIKEFQEKNNFKFKNIYALPRGGLCLGVKLSYLTKLPLILETKDITKNTLIVDDCTDTGKTLSKFKDYITVVMFHKSSSFFKPNINFCETNKQINFCWESKEERN